MSKPNSEQGKASPAECLITALPELLVELRRNGFDVGAEQYLAANDLIIALTLVDDLVPPKVLRPGMAGLFSSSREQQDAFPQLFDSWYSKLGLETVEEPGVSPQQVPATLTWNHRLRLMLGRYRGYALIISLFLGFSLAWWQRESAPITQQPAPVDTRVEVGQRESDHTPISTLSITPLPQSPAEPVIPPVSFWPAWTDWSRLLWIVPFVLWCFWFLSLVFLRRVVLKKRKQRPGETISLKHLELAADQANLFSSPDLAETWRFLRRYRTQPTRRLDEAASVMRTIERGGYFSPVFRERQAPPAYVALNDRRHAQDHAAGMMQELVYTMRRENLNVTLFDYHADPEYAVKVGELGAERNPASLATVYSDHDLLMAGDGEALFETTAMGVRHKLDAFAPFHRRILLTPDPVWHQQHRSDAYEEADFERYPLSPQGVSQLAHAEGKTGWDSLYDLAMPRLLTLDPKAWLEEKRLPKRQLRSLLQQLEDYLGPQGMRLLCATAGYPELNWMLTRALDLQLGLTPSERPLRLRKLSRLPWFRYAQMPDYLRLALLRHIEPSAFQELNRAFRALLENADDNPLKLPYVVPEWRGIWAYWKDQIRLSLSHHPLADRVFASVVRGRRPGLLEFALPHWWQGSLGVWRGLVLPLVTGLVLLPLVVWLNLWVWQAWLEPKARLTALAAMQETHSGIAVTITAPNSLSQYSQALVSVLTNWGFSVQTELALPPSDIEKKRRILNRAPNVSNAVVQSGSVAIPRNQIYFRPQDKTTAGLIAQRLNYLYYGQEAELIESNQVHRRDDWVNIVLEAAPNGFRDALKGGAVSIQPVMVRIEGGEFNMGTNPRMDGDAEKNEQPRHSVMIKPFYLGQYEVTFTQYAAFATATNRELPNDHGWGHASRPVINVSWEDAVDYAEWLTQQTGKAYRLPTEAEWEYASRAGSTTKYSWGNEINLDGKVWANCNGCGSQWDNKQTAPVGSYEANPFGLYDMAGNVWEWTQDCWHDDYRYAPSDGAAWLERDKGDCQRRMVRGGGWYANPSYLRSAYRSGYGAHERYSNLGFRLAMDLPIRRD
jgi:formylglycine-generating enzyme required for sulfatase activity